MDLEMLNPVLSGLGNKIGDSLNGELIGVMSAYPVPMVNTLTIGGVDVESATIYSIIGTVVATGTQSINVEHLTSGVYILKVITSSGRTLSTKIVK